MRTHRAVEVKLFAFIPLRCVIPVVCVTYDREESVVKQHNLM